MVDAAPTLDRLDYIIPGAMKAGTTALNIYLREHPQIVSPHVEARFFSDRYDRGLAWYLDFVQRDTHPDQHVFGEKTVTYAYRDGVAQRIHQHFPNVKFIWLFRHPIKRMISQYRQFYGFGKEWLPFEPAVRTAAERMAQSSKLQDLDYRLISTYAPQVETYLQYFDRSQMFFILSEQFLRAPEPILRQVLTFLGVDPDYPLQGPTTQPRVNPTDYSPINVRLQRFSWHHLRLISPRLHKWIRRHNRQRKPLEVSISPAFEAELTDYFRPHNEALARLTGLDVSLWNM